jgi:predicted  nucleic acid-binding Zn-ribbon protein
MVTRTHKEEQTEQTAAEQIHQRSLEEIQRLQGQRTEIIEQIGTATQELTAIPQDHEERHTRLDGAKASVDRLEAQLAQATHYAKISHGTAGSASAVKEASDIQRQVTAARKALEATEHEINQADQTSEARKQELTAQLTQLHGDKERLEAELSNAQVTYQRAHSELGQLKFNAIIAEDDELTATVTDRENQRLAAQIKHHEFLEKAQDDLKDWPSLQHELRKRQAPENATLQALRAAIGYINTLLATGHNLIDRFPPQVPSAFPAYNYQSWWQALGISFDQELRGPHGIGGDATLLRAHRANLVKMADEYQAYLVSAGQ